MFILWCKSAGWRGGRHVVRGRLCAGRGLIADNKAPHERGALAGPRGTTARARSHTAHVTHTAVPAPVHLCI